MADTTAEPTSPDPKAAKQPKEKQATGPVLIVIHRDGVYRSSRHEKREPPKGAGAQDPKQRIESHNITLYPGLNLVDRELWTKVYDAGSHTGLRKRIERGTLEILGGRGAQEWPAGWAKVAGPTQIAHVQGTTDVATLEAMLDVEQHEKVADAMRAQLAKIRGDSLTGRMTRASQRTQHRAALRR